MSNEKEYFAIGKKMILRIEWQLHEEKCWLDFFTEEGLHSIKINKNEIKDIIEALSHFKSEVKNMGATPYMGSIETSAQVPVGFEPISYPSLGIKLYIPPNKKAVDIAKKLLEMYSEDIDSKSEPKSKVEKKEKKEYDNQLKKAQQELIKKIDECIDKMPVTYFDSDAFLEFYEKLKAEVKK